MKKILLTILIFVASFSLAGAAIAASPKPPATICFSTMENQFGSVFFLLIKPMGNIKLPAGPLKFYSIQGMYIDSINATGGAAVSGSGYMDGPVFRFSLNVTYTWQGDAGFFQADGNWYVNEKTGPIHTYWHNATRHSWSLVQVSCTGQ